MPLPPTTFEVDQELMFSGIAMAIQMPLGNTKLVGLLPLNIRINIFYELFPQNHSTSRMPCVPVLRSLLPILRQGSGGR